MANEQTPSGDEPRDPDGDQIDHGHNPENVTETAGFSSEEQPTVSGARFGGDGADGASDSQPETISFNQTARLGELVPIFLVNLILNIVTLSIYRFWARTRVRRYLWSRTLINGEALEYTGKGSELFFGFLIILFIVFLPLIAAVITVDFYVEPLSAGYFTFYIVLYLLFMWLFGMAIYRARRFRLSRTRWRSVRFGQSGSAKAYSWRFFGFLFLTPLTLGLATPWRDTTLFRYAMNNTWFGDRRFKFEGGSGPLYVSFIIALVMAAIFAVGAVIGLGAVGMTLEGMEQMFDPESADPSSLVNFLIIFYVGFFAIMIAASLPFAWYYARQFSYFAKCTSLEGLQFRFKASALGILWLIIGNGLILIFTLGLGIPFTQMRIFRFIFHRLSAEGEIDVSAIQQSSLETPGAGEGLADAFDLGTV